MSSLVRLIGEISDVSFSSPSARRLRVPVISELEKVASNPSVKPKKLARALLCAETLLEVESQSPRPAEISHMRELIRSSRAL